MRRNRISLFVIALSTCFARSQGFLNLDFEAAEVGRIGNIVYITNAFPGWTVGAPHIYYNDASLSGGSISICDSNFPLSGVNHIQGNYFTFLASVNTPGPGNNITISLGQTGQIPLSARTIEFWGNIGNMQITFAGQSLSFRTLATTANHNVYGEDITAYAGQTGQLLFALSPFLHLLEMPFWITSSFPHK